MTICGYLGKLKNAVGSIAVFIHNYNSKKYSKTNNN